MQHYLTKLRLRLLSACCMRGHSGLQDVQGESRSHRDGCQSRGRQRVLHIRIDMVQNMQRAKGNCFKTVTSIYNACQKGPVAKERN